MDKNFYKVQLKIVYLPAIALALFGPIVGLRTVAKNEVLVVQPKWFIVLLIVVVCAFGRFLINIYIFKRDQKYWTIKHRKSNCQFFRYKRNSNCFKRNYFF